MQKNQLKQKQHEKQMSDLKEIAVVVVPLLMSGSIVSALSGGGLPLVAQLLAQIAVVLCVVGPYRALKYLAQKSERSLVPVRSKREDGRR